MSYNAHLSKAGLIPAKSAAAATAVTFPIIPATDQRVTIPFIRLRAGAAGGNLAVIQTEAPYKFSLKASGAVLTIAGIPTGLSGRHVVIRHPGGEMKATTITAQTGEAVTLADNMPVTDGSTLYLMGNVTNPNTALFPLTVSASTVLQADCPGVAIGKELGWPVLLFLVNTDGDQKIEGGTIAYIGV